MAKEIIGMNELNMIIRHLGIAGRLKYSSNYCFKDGARYNS